MKVKLPNPARNEPQIVTEDQFAALLGKFESTCAHMLALISYDTGMRLGEVLPLSWEDVDLAEHTLEVPRSYSHMGENGNPIFKKPKTRAGKRTVEIGAILSGALRKHRAHQAERKLGTGSSWQIIMMSCARRATEAHWSPRPLHPVTRKAKALDQKVTFHGLRHTMYPCSSRVGFA